MERRRADRAFVCREDGAFLLARSPTPDIVLMGRGDRKSDSLPGYTTVRPQGLSMSEAIFAMVLLVPNPIEHVIPSSETRCCMRRATEPRIARIDGEEGRMSRNAC